VYQRESPRTVYPARVLWAPFGSLTMKTMLGKLIADECGGEVMEYALVLGLIVLACIAIISSIGSKALARYNSMDASL
jgi:Flp pilus assembly pilin Flp